MVKYITITKTKKQELYYNMKTRCYNDNYHEAKPSYTNCSICDEWLDDKKLFYEWVDHNFYEIDGEPTVELDKDILVPGNKTYSPETCVFAPKRINDLFPSLSKNSSGLPTGVTYSKKTGKYKAAISKNGKQTTLGFFDTAEEAAEVYKWHKKAEIIHVADEYKNRIPDALYKAMLNYPI